MVSVALLSFRVRMESIFSILKCKMWTTIVWKWFRCDCYKRTIEGLSTIVQTDRVSLTTTARISKWERERQANLTNRQLQTDRYGFGLFWWDSDCVATFPITYWRQAPYRIGMWSGWAQCVRLLVFNPSPICARYNSKLRRPSLSGALTNRRHSTMGCKDVIANGLSKRTKRKACNVEILSHCNYHLLVRFQSHEKSVQ